MEQATDIEHLIWRVEMRPVLWDKTLEEYKSQDKTVAAWIEVSCDPKEVIKCCLSHSEVTEELAMIFS